MPKATLIPNTQTGSLTDHQVGSADTLLISSLTPSTLYGDALYMFDHSQGGNDHLTAEGGFIQLYGDADQMFDHSRGGDDHLTGNAFGNDLYGDAKRMHGNAHGGNDTLSARG